MSWITENPWPLMLILGGISAVLLILGETRARVAALLCTVAAGGLYFLEGSIVTPAERVEQRLQEMLDAFITEDSAAIARQISEKSPGLNETAKQGLELVQLDDGFHMENVIVTLSSDEQSAIVELRANGMLTLRQSAMQSHAATRWRTKWVLESGEWKLAEVTRLNPLNGETIGVLDPQ